MSDRIKSKSAQGRARNINSCPRVPRLGRSFMPTVLLVAMALGSTASVRAQTVSSGIGEMRAAEGYATAATKALRVHEIHLDLRRVLRCLEGQQAAQDRAPVEATCRGAGAINDLPAGSVNHLRVSKAIKLAEIGVTLHDLQPARYTAMAVQTVLAEGRR